MKIKLSFFLVTLFSLILVTLSESSVPHEAPSDGEGEAPVLDQASKILDGYFLSFDADEKSQQIRLEIRKLFVKLYDSRRYSQIISLYNDHVTLWEQHNYYVPRQVIGKSFFKEERYEEALFQFEQWYDETPDIGNVPSFRDPRFFIIRTLLFLYPYIALAQMITLLLGFVLPLLAFIIYFSDMEKAFYFMKTAFCLSCIIFILQCLAHFQLDTFSTRTFFILLSAFVRNFLFVCAGCLLMLRLHLPCLKLLRSFRANIRPQLLQTRHLIVRESFAAFLIMVIVTGLLVVIIQPTESPLIAKMGKYFEHPLLSSTLDLNKPSLLLNFVMVGAIVEELYVRLFSIPLLMWLFRKWKSKETLAIIVTSLYWALAHAGMVTPEWYKVLQVFLMGLVLGKLFLRRGIEASILTHVGINVSGVLLVLILGGN